MKKTRQLLAAAFALLLTAVSMAHADRVGGYGLERAPTFQSGE